MDKANGCDEEAGRTEIVSLAWFICTATPAISAPRTAHETITGESLLIRWFRFV
jgi:hypothetical protein